MNAPRPPSGFGGEGLPVLLLSLLLWACPRDAETPEVAPPPPASPWVRVKPAGAAAVLEGPARVLAGPGASAVVTPPLRGTVVKVRVRPGDVVAAGAPVVDVVMPEVLDAAGRFEGARARLEAWSARAEQLEKLRAEGLARALDVSEARASVAEAKADLQAARAVLLAAGLKEGDVPGLLAGSGAVPLRAPVAGVVVEVLATLGASRDPSADPLVRLASTGAIRVEAHFPRAPPDGDWSLVTPLGRFPLSLVARAPTADERDGTFAAWFEPHDGGVVAAGTLGRVSLTGEREAGVVRVPAKAVHRVDGVPTVTVRRGGESTALPVQVLQCPGAECLVRGALVLDDEVAAEGPR
ncbi:MAG: efflux RND transporter periplasmic adaptor subunit [Myxococcales bacterium]|nr:efflux RND transporter periplasmic adaptor subunit [Myxococcales bacterium]